MAIAMLVVTPAQATQLIVEVKPHDGAAYTALLGAPGSQGPARADLPSSNTAAARVGQLASMGMFPAAGQVPDLSEADMRALMTAVLTSDLVASTTPIQVPGYVGDVLDGARGAGSQESQADLLDRVLGVLLHEGVGSRRAANLSSIANPADIARFLPTGDAAAGLATFAQPPVDRSDERDERLAELIRKYTEEQGGDPDPAPLPDRFENYPFTFARDYTDDIESNVTRSGEYHGFARGKDFANADIDGGVTLKFDLASSAIFGKFDFGSTGLLHVSGNVDADALAMHLDDTQRSSFSGFELDRASATFDDVNFFGPTGEEIGGYWGINIEQGVAWGEFATGRKP